ncbi:hypothetical protein F2P81_007564 [Scophthalmus maximus]|uniref:Uncharacterized protein n=1 Tax=Scophthalmus maximus TaxID=52904 RepID=A0A6A4T385_SCOMX|nr:hypothetical protein F2P81_007564 [Scophthalmus maximus]
MGGLSRKGWCGEDPVTSDSVSKSCHGEKPVLTHGWSCRLAESDTDEHCETCPNSKAEQQQLDEVLQVTGCTSSTVEDPLLSAQQTLKGCQLRSKCFSTLDSTWHESIDERFSTTASGQWQTCVIPQGNNKRHSLQGLFGYRHKAVQL